MPVAWKVEETCPNCGGEEDAWMFEKEEPTLTKEHYTCETCGWEWTERRHN